MKLSRLIAELQDIADHNNPDEIEVVVEGWDDNYYDGEKIEGIRLVNNRDYDKNEISSVLFIIKGQGR